MRWSAVLLLAGRGLARRPGRTVLTTLGVILGSALLVTLATVSQIADSRVLSYIGKGGPAASIVVAAAAPGVTALDSDNPQNGAPRDLPDDVVAAIAATPHVAAVTPVLGAKVSAFPLSAPDRTGHIPSGNQGFRLGREFDETVVGLDLSKVGDTPVNLVAGRLPTHGSLTEIAVTRGYLDRLSVPAEHPEWVVGTVIEILAGQPQGDNAPARIEARRLAVVGVVDQQIGDGQFFSDIALTRALHAWESSGPTADSIPLANSPYSGLVVVADGIDSVHGLRVAITTSGYSTRAPEHLISTVQKYLHVVDIVLGAVGLVALVIAVLGIGNALLAAVRERRQQIGVLKAIGARDSDIVRWFIAEAMLVGVTGGLIGTALGLGGAYAVGARVNDYLVTQALQGIDYGGVPVGIIAAGVFGSAILALLAAAIPAFVAARLPAREALNAA